MEELDCWGIHCFVHITEEGAEEGATTGGGGNNSEEDGGAQQDPNNVEKPPTTQENVPAEIAYMLETTTGAIDRDDEDLVRNILPGMVDDDNQPLPENIPTEGEETDANTMQLFSEWEHSGSCYHCLEGGCKNKARINFNYDVKPTIQQLFELFFFKPFVEGTIITQTNKWLQEEKHCPVSYGKFLHWIGLWFLMATIEGPEYQEFWSLGEIDWFTGAPMRLGTYMSRKQFDTILKAHSITSHDPPALRDCFWEICDIVKVWNENMMEQFTPSWVSSLDESMHTWTNKYSCPGWMFVPHKHGLLAMSITWCVAHCQEFFGKWRLWKGRMLFLRLFLNSTTKEKQLDPCFSQSLARGTWQWVLCIEGNSGAKEAWGICFHFNQKVEVLAQIHKRGSNQTAF